MGDNEGRAGGGSGPGTEGGFGGGFPNGVGDFMRMMTMFLQQQQRTSASGQGATKALRVVRDKWGMFDGKDVTRYLREYTSEMEVYEVPDNRMMEMFGLAVVPELRERVRELGEEAMTSWRRFEERLKEEYINEDSERITKRSFVDWVEQRPGRLMGTKELLKEFEKKYNQLPLTERAFMDTKKTELFLQAADKSLVQELRMFLSDGTAEGGFTNEWHRVVEAVVLVDKQQRVIDGGMVACPGTTPSSSLKPTSGTSNPTSSSKASKTVPDDTLEELVKGLKDLRVEMSELRRIQKPEPYRATDGPKPFVKRCMWCDGTDHDRSGCTLYGSAIKDGLVCFKEGKIRLTSTDEPLNTNFGRGGMKKLVDDIVRETRAARGKDTESYNIVAGQCDGKAPSTPSKEVMIRGAQTIRKITGWNDPVDSSSIKAFLSGVSIESEHNDAFVEAKRGRNEEEEAISEPATRRKSPRLKETIPESEEPTASMGRRPEVGSSKPYPGEGTSLPKEKWEERMKGKEKEDLGKGKGKGPAYKLQSDIESSVDMKGILEERILDAKIEFTLREALGIAKKGFHELIIDVIKRKRQITAETVMTHALDTSMTKEEEEEIGHVFNLICESDTNDNDFLTESDETEILQMFAETGLIDKKSDKGMEEEAIVSGVGVYTYRHHNEEAKSKEDFAHPFWARATTETRVKLGDCDEPILALVDHGSEINIMSRKVYKVGKWPIDTKHGWVLKAANNQRGGLYGACPAVKTKIGDVEVEQNFFVQDIGSYPVILGQPYITASRMETRVLDDGSHYARIRSRDGKKSVQFLTVESNHKRHRDQLRDEPLKTDEEDEYQDF